MPSVMSRIARSPNSSLQVPFFVTGPNLLSRPACKSLYKVLASIVCSRQFESATSRAHRLPNSSVRTGRSAGVSEPRFPMPFSASPESSAVGASSVARRLRRDARDSAHQSLPMVDNRYRASFDATHTKKRNRNTKVDKNERETGGFLDESRVALWQPNITKLLPFSRRLPLRSPP